MEKKYHYATVSKALEELKEKGFTYDFNLHEDDIVKNPDHYQIVHIYR
jgi:DNA-binding transcriptional regulator YhcF (GntR family)